MSVEKSLPDEYKPVHDLTQRLYDAGVKLEDEGAEAGDVQQIADELAVWVDSKRETVEYGVGEPPPEG